MPQAVSMINTSPLYISVTDEAVTRKYLWYFFPWDLTIVTEDALVSGFDEKFKGHICLILPGSSRFLSIKGLIIVKGKPIKRRSLRTVTHGWKLTACQWANRKRFLSALGIIWNSKVAFYNKITYLLRRRCFNRDLSV